MPFVSLKSSGDRQCCSLSPNLSDFAGDQEANQ
jgi:hypothetical protein